MILKPRFMRDLDDDSAPVDYTCVSSVSEGVRIQRAQKIHSEERTSPSAPIVRHRADPDAGSAADVYGTRPRRSARAENPNSGRVMSGLPSAKDGPAPAQSIAYPEDYGIPDNPFSPPPETQQPVRRTRAAKSADDGERRESGLARDEAGTRREPDSLFAPASQGGQPIPRGENIPAAQTRRPAVGARIARPAERPVITSEDGSQFEPPVRPEIPEWLRVAQQNNMPLRRPEAPRVRTAPPVEEQEAEPTDLLGRPIRNRASAARAMSAAAPDPQSVEAYREAGYPPELLARQEQIERERAAQPIRRRHGAQFAVNQYSQQEYEKANRPASTHASYPPSREAYARSQSPQAPAVSYAFGENNDFAPAQGRGQAYAAAAQTEQGYMHPVRINADYDGTDMALAQEEWQEEPEKEKRNIPWLAIAAFAAAMAAVALWLMQMNFSAQTEQVLEDRRAAQEAIEEKHPLYFEELIAEKANKYNLSPAFVAAIMLNESSFRTDATSSVNARGLMQLMDDTASWIHDKMNLSDAYSFDDLYDAQTNVEYGCWYLNYLSGTFLGDPVLVAASFHAGQNEVKNWLSDSRYSSDGVTIALENLPEGPTKQYVTRVINDFAAYKRLYYENTEDDA